MLTEALGALAGTGGTALVTAMVTDGWEGFRSRIANLFGRGDNKEAQAALERLEQSRAALAVLTGAELERARAEQEIIWRTRLGDLLERDPGAEDQLRGLVAEIQGQTIGAAGSIVQNMTAYDRAQQAVQGQGVQSIRFGHRLSEGQQSEGAALDRAGPEKLLAGRRSWHRDR